MRVYTKRWKDIPCISDYIFLKHILVSKSREHATLIITLLTKTAARNEAALSYLRVRGLYFHAVVIVATIITPDLVKISIVYPFTTEPLLLSAYILENMPNAYIGADCRSL